MSDQRSAISYRAGGAGIGAALRALGVLLLFAALWGAAPAAAQGEVVPGRSSTIGTPATEAVAREAFFRLRSPVTPSHTLDMCPAGEAEALRDTMRIAAAEGQSVNQLVEGVIARYGEHMRILPERRGKGLWAWLMPPAALLLGVSVLTLRLRHLRRQGGFTPVDVGSDNMTDEERARLDAALAELEEGQEEPV